MTIPATVLVAPDSFKGTFSARKVAALVGSGLRRAGWSVDECPLADGGEGTAATLLPALGGEWAECEVSDPLGRPLVARYLRAGDLAVIDCAAASGLGLVPAEERDALAASTRGTGEMIREAARAGARRVLLGAGGSATTDGGAGALEALSGTEVQLTVLCDVRTRWEQAAQVFSPQKGADPADVKALTMRLDRLARRMLRDPRGVPMTGAAGGLAGGLWSEYGAQLVGGAGYVLEAVGFDVRMRAAAAVVVGEGRLDRQSLAGKVVSEAATRARQSGVPCHAVVGRAQLSDFGLRILDIGEVMEASTEGELEAAGEALGRRIRADRSTGR